MVHQEPSKNPTGDAGLQREMPLHQIKSISGQIIASLIAVPVIEYIAPNESHALLRALLVQ